MSWMLNILMQSGHRQDNFFRCCFYHYHHYCCLLLVQWLFTRTCTVCLNGLIWKHAATLLHYGVMTLLWRTGETNCEYISEHCNSNTWFRAIAIGICCHIKHLISHIVTTRLNGVESTGSYINLLGEVSENLNTWGDYGVRTIVSDVMKMTNRRLSTQAHADMKNISCQNFSVLKNKFPSLI